MTSVGLFGGLGTCEKDIFLEGGGGGGFLS